MRVALADDSLLFREGLSSLLVGAGFTVTASVGDAGALIRAVTADPPDVAIIDIRMPPTQTNEGLVAALDIRSACPHVGVMVLSHHVETHHAMKLLRGTPSGSGYLLKDRVADLEDFIRSVRRVASGGSAVDPEIAERMLNRHRASDPLARLSKREREILSLIAQGRSNRGIANALSLTVKTVETHVAAIFCKLGLVPAADEHRRVLAVLAHLQSIDKP